MSRHRDVRSMNYSEEYEGYDDVYGHSVEDDYCVSPSAEQFLFDRSKQQNIASFITEPDIIEDNEDTEELLVSSKEEDVVLTELERAKLISCMESIKNVIGDTVPEFEIKKKIIQSNFDAEMALDSILKESPPRNATEPFTVNKDNLESHPDAASIKSRPNLFSIPKLPFNKQENIENTNEKACIMNNLESFKNLNINNSFMRFSSPLSDFTSNPADLSFLNSTTSTNTVDTVPFKSLADLTAHHLQKTVNSSGSTNSNGEIYSPKATFVIPKLSIKNDNRSNFSRKRLDLADILSYIKINDSSDLNEESLSNEQFAHSRSFTNLDIKNNPENVESGDNLILNARDARTPSPDPWIIDLSSALKEVTTLVSDNYGHTKLKVIDGADDTIPNLSLQASNPNIEIPYAILPTTLNLSCLKYVKLPYTKKNVSMFGKTLCRKWKFNKPIVKIQNQHYGRIKRFDFSVPYGRSSNKTHDDNNV